MKKLHLLTLVLAGFLFSTGGVYAQQSVSGAEADKIIPGSDLILYRDARSTPDYVRFAFGRRYPNDESQRVFSEILKLREGDELRLKKTLPDDLGMVHYTYQHYYFNIPVEFSEYRTHTKDGSIISVNGEFYNDFQVNLQPAVSAESAVELAKLFVGATAYRWEDSIQEAYIKIEQQNPNATFAPQPELVIVSVDGDYVNPNFRLAWKMDIYASEPLSRNYIYVDALTGQVIFSVERIHEADTPGSAATGFSGTRTLTADSFNGSFRLREAGRGNGISTFDLNNGTNYGNAVDFTDSDNNWINPNPSIDRYALDAHWGSEMTYDYYMAEHNHNSIDGNGFAMFSYVHYSNNYQNAFWDGQRMTYGDGNPSGTLHLPLTTLDITGHEVTHGVTENSANLIYQNESGALNESFSDIFGACIDFFARGTTAPNLWRIGDECTSSGNGIRNMANPGQFGDPDTYGTGNWYSGTQDNGGVHWNSGVQNFWFYLLSQGGTGTNDYGNAYNVSGIGMSNAADIAFRNLTVYLGPNSNYAAARQYAIISAEDLFGACSPEVIATTNAWYAVGVGGVFNASVTAAFSAPATSYCDANAVINFTNTSTNGNTYTWNFGDGNTSNAANPSHVYGAAGVYTVTLTADGGPCGIDTEVLTNYITINPPATPTANGVATCNPSGSFALTASGSGTLNWYTTPGGTVPVHTGTTYNTPNLNTTTTYYVENTTASPSVFGGPVNQVFGAGGFHNNGAIQYQMFTVAQACTLKTVLVNAGSSGNRTIYLWDGNGNQITTVTVNIPNGTSTITLNLPLQPGSYRIGGMNMNLYRNTSGAAYPYAVGTLASITGASAGGGYYYYFYNWEMQADPCASARVPVTVTFNAPPAVTANASATSVCLGAQVILTGGGAQSYSWNNGVNDGVAFSPTNTTTYTVTGTDANNCSGTASVTVNVVPAPNVTAQASATAVCSGSPVTLTGQGAQSYTWNNGVNDGVPFTPAISQAYIVTGDNGNNCINTDTIFITVNSLPAVSALASSHGVCEGGSLTLTGLGAQSYAWDNGVTDGVPFVPVSSNTYTVTGTDGNNCSNTATITVNVNPNPNVSFVLPVDTICAQSGIIQLSGSPAGGVFTGSGVNGSTFDPAVGAGNYFITYTYLDTNGCSGEASSQLVVQGCLGTGNISGPQVQIYPNPSSGNFTLEISEWSDNTQVYIYNALGEVVQQLTMTSPVQSVRIDAAGIYWIRIATLETTISKQVIVW